MQLTKARQKTPLDIDGILDPLEKPETLATGISKSHFLFLNFFSSFLAVYLVYRGPIDPHFHFGVRVLILIVLLLLVLMTMSGKIPLQGR